MPRQIRPATSVENLKKEAKRWLRDLRADKAAARARFERAWARGPSRPVLRDVQHALAREYGFRNWIALTKAAQAQPAASEPLRRANAAEYQQRAEDLVRAFDAKDNAALQRVNAFYGRSFSFDDLWAEIWRRVYAFRQRAFNGTPQQLALAEAQSLIAHDAGYGGWAALLRAVTTGAKPIPAYEIDPVENAIAPRRLLAPNEWDELIAVARERGITTLHAHGQATGDVMRRIAGLGQITALNLGGSRLLDDDGLLELARMPQLEHLDLSEYPGGKLTDRGLAVLRHLPNLRTFEMTWQRGITDAGAANLRFCDRLESVTLMGSPTGDGAIDALQGKPHLRKVHSGRLVTDAGLALLRNFPVFKAGDNGSLLVDGPFSDEGLKSLAGLAGIVDLDLFWHVTALTESAFAHLIALPNLASLGADGKLSGNAAMRYMAAMPRLRKVRIQESIASDEGFEALSRSPTLEQIWGRVCPHFGSRGFQALSAMASLRTLGIGCANVDDAALSSLPRFPSLRELTPIGVKDDGFRHVGACDRLERLTCMYCRDITDAATAHIARLNISYYYAGLTQITDRSLEILGGMTSLEQIEFYECLGVTDAGLPHLVRLPRLREVHVGGSPGVTLDGTRVFPSRVRVKYSQ
jgi:hypothetical protein